MSANRDKIKFLYAEACVEIRCAVCHLTFTEFPGYNEDEPSLKRFECPKCRRQYEFKYSIEAKTNEEVINETLRRNKII